MVISARVGLIVDACRTERWTNTVSELARMSGGEFTRPNNRFTIILQRVNSKAVLTLSPMRLRPPDGDALTTIRYTEIWLRRTRHTN